MLRVIIGVVILLLGLGLVIKAVGFAFSLLWSLALGLVIGGLARAFLPGAQALGLVSTALYGVAGSFVGGGVARLLGFGGLLAVAASVVCAALLIVATTSKR